MKKKFENMLTLVMAIIQGIAHQKEAYSEPCGSREIIRSPKTQKKAARGMLVAKTARAAFMMSGRVSFPIAASLAV